MNDQEKSEKEWILRLYVAGLTPLAERALNNINKICVEHLQGRYSIDVVDILEQPALAERDQIFAVPTLVRQLPLPLRKIIGDMSNTAKVVFGLDLRPAEQA